MPNRNPFRTLCSLRLCGESGLEFGVWSLGFGVRGLEFDVCWALRVALGIRTLVPLGGVRHVLSGVPH